jgi:hypothetical protein
LSWNAPKKKISNERKTYTVNSEGGVRSYDLLAKLNQVVKEAVEALVQLRRAVEAFGNCSRTA